ncbi:MAG: hypothetical protein V4693_22415 [Pseudomonadota bacterium]
MTYAPFRPLQSKNRIRPRVGSTSVITPQGNGDATGVLQTPLVQPRKLGGPRALAGNIDAFVPNAPSRVAAFLSKRARIRAKRWAHGASSTLEQMINKAVEEKLAERLNPPSEAVAAARERGAAWKRTEYANPGNLSLEQASEHVGLSTRVINERRNDGRYYALLAEGQTRGFRFPRWQFDVPEQRLQSVLAIARAAGSTAWGIHVFMISPSSLLDGAAPRDWISDAAQDLERVAVLARNRFHGDQGAG